jgi:hypothetical protein
MKLYLTTSTDEEHDDVIAIVDLPAEQAQTYLMRREQFRAIAKDDPGLHEMRFWDGTPHFHTGDMVDDARHDVHQNDGDEIWGRIQGMEVLLGNLALDPSENVVVDNTYGVVTHLGVMWIARHRYDENLYTTARVSWDIIEQIAKSKGTRVKDVGERLHPITGKQYPPGTTWISKVIKRPFDQMNESEIEYQIDLNSLDGWSLVTISDSIAVFRQPVHGRMRQPSW